MDRSKEKKLAKQMQSGNKDAFFELARYYHDLCYQIAYVKIRHREVALEMTREALIKAWKLRFLLSSNKSFFSYLIKKLTMPSNISKSFTAGASIEGPHDEQIGEGFYLFTTHKQRVQSKRETALIEDLLQRKIFSVMTFNLNSKQRCVYVLSRMAGFSHSDIAHLLGIADQEIEKHLGKALKTLRRYCKSSIGPSHLQSIATPHSEFDLGWLYKETNLKLTDQQVNQALTHATQAIPIPPPGELDSNIQDLEAALKHAKHELNYLLRPYLSWLVPLITLTPFILLLMNSTLKQPPSSFEPEYQSQREIYLKDNSFFYLQKGSRLDVVEGYARDHRDLLLRGEAMFFVEKGEMPLRIQAGSTMITATEASFNVTQQDDRVILHVLRGTVTFASTSGQNPPTQTIKALQVASFNLRRGMRQSQSFSVRHFQEWRPSRKFHFKNRSLFDVCSILARHFDVDVTLDPSLQNQKITAQVEAPDPQTAFEKISGIARAELIAQDYHYSLAEP